MNKISLVPARGRDYKSALAVRIALAEENDFIVADMSSPWDGKPCNIADLRQAGIRTANVRYAQLRKVTVVDLERNIE